jgi:hypothetical protein
VYETCPVAASHLKNPIKRCLFLWWIIFKCVYETCPAAAGRLKKSIKEEIIGNCHASQVVHAKHQASDDAHTQISTRASQINKGHGEATNN